jgi:TRAP-type mannitol/chloroaromatic compound transport system permease small subunit
MVLVGVWNVFGRFFGQYIGVNLTSNALIETQWYLFSLVFFLGAPYALLHGEHVRVDVVYARINGTQRAWVNLLGTLLFLIPFALFIIYFSWNFIGTSWSGLEQSPDPGGLPRYPIKAMIAVSMVLLIVQGISEIVKNIARLRGQYPLETGENPTAEQALTTTHPEMESPAPPADAAPAADGHPAPPADTASHDSAPPPTEPAPASDAEPPSPSASSPRQDQEPREER